MDWDALDPAVQQTLEGVPAEALQAMQAKLPTLAPVTNGWQMNTDSIGVYGDYYLKQAIVSMVGLGANPPEDAVYPWPRPTPMASPSMATTTTCCTSPRTSSHPWTRSGR